MSYTLTSTALLLLLSAYLLGSLSSAIVVCRLMKLGDPRLRGSGNPGATNVLRLGGRKAAVATLLGDLAKGLLPVILARLLEQPVQIQALIGLAAVTGHLLPLFFGFRGGKGVATTLGICCGLNPWLGAAQLGCWLLLMGLFRISSVAGIVTALLTPLIALQLIPEAAPVLALACLLLILRHHRNIQSLLKGKEHRF